MDYTEIDFDVSGFGKAHISVTIANSSGIIREYVHTSHPDGHIKVRWDGRDSQGYPVEDGTYNVTVKVTQNSLKYLHSFDKYMWPADRPKGMYSGNYSFGAPSDVAIDSRDFLYVIDNNLFIYKPDGTSYNMVMGVSGAGIDIGPDDVAFLPSTFQKVDAEGNLKTYTANGKSGWLSFDDAAINSSGYVFIAGSDNTEGWGMGPFLRLYDPNLSFIRTLASQDSGPIDYMGKNGVAVNSSDYVFVTEPANMRVSIFDPSGQYYGEIYTDPLQPLNVAIDHLDNLYITMDYDMPKIWVYSPDGYYIASSGDLSEESVKHPLGIAVSSDGHIYLCNINKHNILVFFIGISSQTGEIVVDRSPVQVLSVDPSPGSTTAVTGTPITVRFSKTIDPATLNDGAFLLNNGSVNWTVVYDQQTATARFEPEGMLQPDTEYHARLTKGIADLNGNPMSAEVTWNFTTCGVTKPTVTSAPTSTPVTTPGSTSAGSEGILLAGLGILLAGLLVSRRR